MEKILIDDIIKSIDFAIERTDSNDDYSLIEED